MTCPECGGKAQYCQHGERICVSCGLVIDETPIGQDTFAVSRAELPQLAVAGTVMNGRIVKNNWLKTTREKNLASGLNKVELIASQQRIPEYALREAKRIFKLAVETTFNVGRDHNCMAYACVYAACLVQNVPKTPLEMVAYTDMSQKKLMKMFRILKQYLGIRVGYAEPGNYIERFGSRVGLKQSTISQALEMAERLRGTSAVQGKNPRTIAAAVLYLALKANREHTTQRELANAVGVIEVTIRRRSQEFNLLLSH
jgi:transcription initiation factor TFIIB